MTTKIAPILSMQDVEILAEGAPAATASLADLISCLPPSQLEQYSTTNSAIIALIAFLYFPISCRTIAVISAIAFDRRSGYLRNRFL
mmetsp:Transcript_4883/g.17731  ORF Transcript_4883/g.17731 Transcript_4883/m.17731 type:complete len:87 (+) Transcript_4883:463-723(+)